MRQLLFLLLIICLCEKAELGQQTRPRVKPRVTCGPVVGQGLACPEFGFRYEIPFGWVDRTEEMQQEAVGDVKPSGTQQSSGKPRTLLSIFERPPGAPGESINSAVVIAVESLKDYRGVHTAADYLGPVTELAQQRGFEVTNEPYGFAIGKKQLARADYSKARGKLTMYQSTLATIEAGSIISFTFVGGSEDEVEELIERLKFGPAGAVHK